MRYIPHTEEDIQEMLELIGVDSLDALFSSIPEELRLKRPLNLPPALPEYDLLKHMKALADQNIPLSKAKASFLGGGVYHHYIPSIVSQILLRSELYTAYTPYQPEISQGTLQIIFEFQSYVAELLACDIANASMYDGSTALAEAALMALRLQKRKQDRIVMSAGVHPEWQRVVKRFLEPHEVDLVQAPLDQKGLCDFDFIEEALKTETKALIISYPNYFGNISDLEKARELCDAHGALLIVAFQDAFSLGLLKPPGLLADIVAGEGQSFGIPMNFGGPHLGLLGCKEAYLRQMPGRIAGETLDVHGNRAFVLTMATREQHIRRERATSNICTNVGLMATAATIAMSLLGPEGLYETAKASHLRSEECKEALFSLPGYAPYFEAAPSFHEFLLKTPVPATKIIESLAKEGIAPGIALERYQDVFPGMDLSHALLVTCTELTSSEDIALLKEALGDFTDVPF